MMNLSGVCGKHKHLGYPATDCEDCREAQRRDMKLNSNGGSKGSP